jgi:hypothetical protein
MLTKLLKYVPLCHANTPLHRHASNKNANLGLDLALQTKHQERVSKNFARLGSGSTQPWCIRQCIQLNPPQKNPMLPDHMTNCMQSLAVHVHEHRKQVGDQAAVKKCKKKGCESNNDGQHVHLTHVLSSCLVVHLPLHPQHQQHHRLCCCCLSLLFRCATSLTANIPSTHQ